MDDTNNQPVKQCNIAVATNLLGSLVCILTADNCTRAVGKTWTVYAFLHKVLNVATETVMSVVD